MYLAEILIKASGINPDSANDNRNLVIYCITFMIFNLDKLLHQEQECQNFLNYYFEELV